MRWVVIVCFSSPIRQLAFTNVVRADGKKNWRYVVCCELLFAEQKQSICWSQWDKWWKIDYMTIHGILHGSWTEITDPIKRSLFCGWHVVVLQASGCLERRPFQNVNYKFTPLSQKGNFSHDLKIEIHSIEFNGMSIRLGLLYANRLGNRVHCTFTLHFCAVVSKKFFAHDLIEYE